MEYPHITLNKIGYEPFIGFLCNCMGYIKASNTSRERIWYSLIGGMQVPLFLLVQTFHSYKRDQRPINLKLITKIIVLSFVLIQVLAKRYPTFLVTSRFYDDR